MNQTKEFLLEDMREGINKVLSGEIEKYENELLSPNHALEYLKEKGFDLDIKDNFHNGWELDAWYDAYNDEHHLILKGSAFSGGLEVYINEEEDNPYTNSQED